VDPCTKPSADAIGIGTSESGQKYILKCAPTWHTQLPASEWICHGLAHSLALPVPPWEHCHIPWIGEAIGSRLEGTVIGDTYVPTARPAADNPEVVSGTFVLDLFVANADRHPGQWLLTDAGGSRLLRPIDFSRAWFRRWPLRIPPFGPGTNLPAGERDNSATFYALARRHSVLDTTEAHSCWQRLHDLPKAAWRGIIQSVPRGWLQPQQTVDLVNWWWSPQWHSRLIWIRSQL
jgi:hypothetical protein